MKVLNTRPREQAAELSRLLAHAGFEVIEAPAIETVPAWDPGELQAVRADLVAGAYEWVILPSQNAGRLLSGDLGHVSVMCGAATARALSVTPKLTLDRFSASAALEALAPVVRPGQRILVPRAAEGRADLTDGLVAMRAHVHAPIAYRTLAVEPWRLADAAARLRNRHVSAVAVCSPSAIVALVAAVEREWISMTRLVCLGETTAEAAREAGLRVDSVAQRTTMASLVEAVRAATHGRPPPPGECGGGGEGCSQAEPQGVPA